MHELSVALALLNGVNEAAERDGIERVSAVHVKVGALSGIARDALLFSWEMACADTIAAGSELRIEDVPVEVFCDQCGETRAPVLGTGLLCPVCGVPAPNIVRGRELQIVAMEVPA